MRTFIGGRFIGHVVVTVQSMPGVLWAVTQEGAAGLANREFMKQINIFLLSGFLASPPATVSLSPRKLC